MGVRARVASVEGVAGHVVVVRVYWLHLDRLARMSVCTGLCDVLGIVIDPQCCNRQLCRQLDSVVCNRGNRMWLQTASQSSPQERHQFATSPGDPGRGCYARALPIGF